MRIIVNVNNTQHPPVLKFYIHDAPHYRMHHRVIQQYREFLVAACMRAGIAVPIETPTDVDILFVNPSSPDNGNLYLAFERAVDGKTLRGPAVFVDDSLIDATRIKKFWPQGKKK